jgi:hypothetical protein
MNRLQVGNCALRFLLFLPVFCTKKKFTFDLSWVILAKNAETIKIASGAEEIERKSEFKCEQIEFNWDLGFVWRGNEIN